MSETDSFIDEVNEEVRRDKLFLTMRKYGWMVAAIVILIVGGAAYNEWRKFTAEAAAQNLGNAIAAALELPEAADRATALDSITAADENAGSFLVLLKAAELAEAGEKATALELLDSVADNADTPELYQNLARLKSVVLQGGDQDRGQRLAELDKLAEPGSPYRVIAMEQKALALIEYGEKSAAISLLGNILEEPQVTQALLQRAQQLIVALGGTLSSDGSRLEQDS